MYVIYPFTFEKLDNYSYAGNFINAMKIQEVKLKGGKFY